jgi:hypothetical protein
MSLTPRYWWRKWCRVWRAWHLDIDKESHVEFEEPHTSTRCQALQILHQLRHQYRGVRLFKLYITLVINIEVWGSSNSTWLSLSISRCQALQTLHDFRHQYRGVRLMKLYITFVINIEVSGSSNITSLSSSISRCQAHQTLHHFRHQYRSVGLVEFDEPDTSILMTKVM